MPPFVLGKISCDNAHEISIAKQMCICYNINRQIEYSSTPDGGRLDGSHI